MKNQDQKYRNTKMLTFEKLVLAIEELENQNIISFDEFKTLSYIEQQKQFFAMASPAMMNKAIIKIEDKKNGKTGASERTIITEKIVNGEVKKISIKTNYF